MEAESFGGKLHTRLCTKRSKLREYFLFHASSSSIAINTSTPIARASCFFAAVREIATTRSHPSVRANSSLKCPSPPHAHDLDPHPRPGPVLLQRCIHRDAAAQRRGRGGTAQRVGDLDDEVRRHAHALAVPAVAAAAVAEHAVARPDELLRAVVLLSRAALIAVRPLAAGSWRSARRLV